VVHTVILDAQEAEIRRIAVQSQPGFKRPYLKQIYYKKAGGGRRLVEWLKV
jgi:hypothetical protein